MLRHLFIHNVIQKRAGGYGGNGQINELKAYTDEKFLLSQNMGKNIGTIITVEHILNWVLSHLAVEW